MKDHHKSSKAIKALRIFLLALIVVGIGLLLTQKTWVPKLVQEYLVSEKNFSDYTIRQLISQVQKQTIQISGQVFKKSEIGSNVFRYEIGVYSNTKNLKGKIITVNTAGGKPQLELVQDYKLDVLFDAVKEQYWVVNASKVDSTGVLYTNEFNAVVTKMIKEDKDLGLKFYEVRVFGNILGFSPVKATIQLNKSSNNMVAELRTDQKGNGYVFKAIYNLKTGYYDIIPGGVSGYQIYLPERDRMIFD